MSHSVISWLAQNYTFFGINPIFVEKEAQLARFSLRGIIPRNHTPGTLIHHPM